MVAFVVYDPTDPYSGDEYAVLRYGDCAAEDVSSQGGSDTAMVVPEASMVNFQFAAQILENPPEPSGSWTALMLVTPATGHIGFMFGSAISSDVDVLQQRDQLLSDSDWTQLADAPLTPAKQAQWATYRQELRDIPSQPCYQMHAGRRWRKVWSTSPRQRHLAAPC
ncbi:MULTISPECIES: phage tail assembly chaperone [Gemmobacter]|uniref:Phage tail assembly chaperone n=1 Tax=Gemmobacter caeni TaxID=589035 RepID=A0A2T6AVJ9_9RHOB|nr:MULTISPECIES: phage tail assembly chaperone [Gemmobacter]PTX47850.1 phage tail assembly chaperone [Gemmobacter caeni]